MRRGTEGFPSEVDPLLAGGQKFLGDAQFLDGQRNTLPSLAKLLDGFHRGAIGILPEADGFAQGSAFMPHHAQAASAGEFEGDASRGHPRVKEE